MNAFDPALEAIVRISTPILLAALGEMILERSGVINIGIEGVMLVGAFCGFCGGWLSGCPWIGALAGMLGGVLLMLVFGLFTLRFRADQIVTGMALNLAALGITGTANQAIKQAHRTEALTSATFAPVFLSQTALTWIALLLIPAIWYYLEHSERGLELRAVGENPAAAEASGVDVLWCRWKTCVAAGLLGGLGGAFLTISQTNSYADNCTRGRGFVALAAVVLGRYGSFGTAAACLFFGAAFYVRDAQSSLRIPTDLVEMLPYVLTLAALCVRSRSRIAPAALGKPYSR
jgi:general nucleoside transport system permease protein